MNRVARVLLVCALAFSVSKSQAVLTLDQCLSQARERSPRLRSAQNAIRAAELMHSELRTTGLPQFRLQVNPIYAPFSSRFGYDPVITDGGQLAGAVVVQQSLYDAGIRGLKSDQLQTDLQRLNNAYRMTERDLVFSVKQAFIETLRSQQEVQLQQEGVQQLSDYLEIVKRLSLGGTASYTDVLKTTVQLSNAQIAREKAMDEYSIAKYSLAELIGGAIDTSFRVNGSLDAVPNGSSDSLLVLSSQDTLGTLETSIADDELRSSLYDVEITQRELWPELALSADAGYLNSGENLKLPPAERSSALGFSVGLVLEVPLISWGATDLRVQQRQLVSDNIRLESELLQRSMTSEIRKTRLQLLRLRDRLKSIRLNLKYADENFLLTKSKFVGGGILSLEVLSAQQLLADTKLSELESLAGIQLLNARLEQLTTR
ncbi:MAG TPA: TolC family protein [Bacteroidota bacterium]